MLSFAVILINTLSVFAALAAIYWQKKAKRGGWAPYLWTPVHILIPTAGAIALWDDAYYVARYLQFLTFFIALAALIAEEFADKEGFFFLPWLGVQALIASAGGAIFFLPKPIPAVVFLLHLVGLGLAGWTLKKEDADAQRASHHKSIYYWLVSHIGIALAAILRAIG